MVTLYVDAYRFEESESDDGDTLICAFDRTVLSLKNDGNDGDEGDGGG